MSSQDAKGFIPSVNSFGRRHVGLSEPEVTIFGQEVGAGVDILIAPY